MDEAELGTLTRQGDRWMLTFTRRLAHPREKVWRAVTEPEHLAAWYPSRCLDRLVSELDGMPQRPMGELWVEVHPRYVTHPGPDAATIGPPAGNDPRGTNA